MSNGRNAIIWLIHDENYKFYMAKISKLCDFSDDKEFKMVNLIFEDNSYMIEDFVHEI